MTTLTPLEMIGPIDDAAALIVDALTLIETMDQTGPLDLTETRDALADSLDHVTLIEAATERLALSESAPPSGRPSPTALIQK